MSKFTLTFTLPEDQHDARMAFDAPKMASVLFRLDQALRERVKYGLEAHSAMYQSVRDELRDALADEGLTYILEGDA